MYVAPITTGTSTAITYIGQGSSIYEYVARRVARTDEANKSAHALLLGTSLAFWFHQ